MQSHHQSPKPAVQPDAHSHPSWWKKWGLAAVFTALLIGAAGTFFVGEGPFTIGRSDHLSQSEAAARVTAFAAAGRISLQEVSRAERAQAVAQTMELSPNDQKAVLADVEADRIKLVWLTLWDDVREDGDIVRVDSGNFSRLVLLQHAPLRIAIPAPANGVVALTGVQDGGGGVTVAVMSGADRIKIPRMSPGQTIDIPVAVQ
jgi:hypothetical protein